MTADEYIKAIRELHHPDPTDEQLNDERYCERARREMDSVKVIEDLMKGLIDAVNTSNLRSTVIPAMVSGLTHGHRTLQENLIEALFCVLGTFGDLPTGQFTDPRNAHSHKMCAKLREVFKEDYFWRDGRPR